MAMHQYQRTISRMKYNQPEAADIDVLKAICGAENVFADTDSLEKYGQDETENLLYKPTVVVRPQTPEQISSVVKLCNEKSIAQPAGYSGAGRHQRSIPGCSPRERIVLSARSCIERKLFSRRQHCTQFRWTESSEVRHHARLCTQPRSGFANRRNCVDRR